MEAGVACRTRIPLVTPQAFSITACHAPALVLLGPSTLPHKAKRPNVLLINPAQSRSTRFSKLVAVACALGQN